MPSYVFAILFVLYILIAGFVLYTMLLHGPLTGRRIRKKILAEPWIDARDLVRDWAGEGKYKAQDGLGCYIMLVFDHEVTDGDYSTYVDSYVGKANKAYKGAYAQLAGKGKREISRDYRKKDRYVYVQVRFYDVEDIDKMERTLIGSVKSNKSYNSDVEI